MLVVTTLGKFQIMSGSGTLRETSFRSPMLSKLFIYILLHRDKMLSIDELAGALWQEDETDNPPGALKNLMYRLRNLLNTELGEENYILTSRGYYQWNNEIPVSLDVEQFDKLITAAQSSGLSTKERIATYEKALPLYQGEFIPRIMDMNWAVIQSAHSHKRYIDAVHKLSHLYFEEENYDAIENLMIHALKVDGVNEELHRCLIQARICAGKMKLAQKAYDQACEILYKELGVRNPASLEEVRKELLNQNHENEIMALNDADKDLREEDPNGVYFVPYEIFKSIYQLESRKTARMGIAEYVLMLTVEMERSKSERALTVEDRTRIADTMDALQETITTSLRLGDVASRFSASQYIILLTNCNYESSLMVANRIIDRFFRENRKMKNMRINMSVEEVSAARNIG